MHQASSGPAHLPKGHIQNYPRFSSESFSHHRLCNWLLSSGVRRSATGATCPCAAREAGVAAREFEQTPATSSMHRRVPGSAGLCHWALPPGARAGRGCGPHAHRYATDRTPRPRPRIDLACCTEPDSREDGVPREEACKPCAIWRAPISADRPRARRPERRDGDAAR